MSPERNVIGLVEDDPIMGESLMQRLTLEGSKVHWWRTKSDALKGLQTSDPDIVICDIPLPDGSGEDLFAEARRQKRTAPFLFMTAFSGEAAMRLGISRTTLWARMKTLGIERRTKRSKS